MHKALHSCCIALRHTNVYIDVHNSNKWQDAMRAKFKLLTTIRTQGEGTEAYECVFECEDAEGERGVRLSKQVMSTFVSLY
jgi:FAE1/Type III polyketide synthase-like protein